MGMTDRERQEFLAGLGLDPDADDLGGSQVVPVSTVPDTDDRLIPASEIAFDESMIEGYDLEDKEQFAQASRVLFERFKSPKRDKERNGLLHRRITEFLSSTKLSRRTSGYVKGQIAVTREHRDMAKVLASAGVTPEDLVELLKGAAK